MEDGSPRNKTNGRWTKEEHLRFLQGLRIYGKNWKKIEQLIATRNGSQIRSHAQKFFLKMQHTTGQFDQQGYTEEMVDEGEQPTLISKGGDEAVRREQVSFFLGKIMDHYEDRQNLDFWSSLIDSKTPTDISNKEQVVSSFRKTEEGVMKHAKIAEKQ